MGKLTRLVFSARLKQIAVVNFARTKPGAEAAAWPLGMGLLGVEAATLVGLRSVIRIGECCQLSYIIPVKYDPVR